MKIYQQEANDTSLNAHINTTGCHFSNSGLMQWRKTEQIFPIALN